MNMFKLILSNLKRYFKDPTLILVMILMPALLSVSVILVSSKSDNSIYLPKVAVVGNLDGMYENKLIKELNANDFSFDLKDKNLAIDLLQNNKVCAIFILENDFSKSIESINKPQVEIIKTQEGGGSIWAESTVESFINSSIKSIVAPNLNSSIVTSNIIEEESLIPGNNVVVVFMISYCLYVCAASFSKDLIDLRSTNVLRRMISTKNTDFEIIFSIFFSLFLVQSISCVVTLIGLNIILNLELTFASIVIIVANCFVSTGFVMTLARVFKTEVGVSLGSVFYSLAAVGLCLSDLLPSLSSNINFVNNLAKLSPIYWTFEAMKNNNVLLSFLALILLGLIFVTAGSFKLKDFAKN
ncbi:MAG: ABC transporter permease [Paraclostridium sp.]